MSLIDELLQTELVGTRLFNVHASPTTEVTDHCEPGGLYSQNCSGHDLVSKGGRNKNRGGRLRTKLQWTRGCITCLMLFFLLSSLYHARKLTLPQPSHGPCAVPCRTCPFAFLAIGDVLPTTIYTGQLYVPGFSLTFKVSRCQPSP